MFMPLPCTQLVFSVQGAHSNLCPFCLPAFVFQAAKFCMSSCCEFPHVCQAVRVSPPPPDFTNFGRVPIVYSTSWLFH